MSMIYFELPMLPPRVTHQSKKIVRVGGYTRLANTTRLNQALRDYAVALKPYAPESPMDGALELTMTFVFPHPGSARKAIRGTYVPKSTRPDYDNLAKTLQDVMTTLHFWYDDSQVWRSTIEKMYGPEPGIRVKVEGRDETWSI